MLRPATPLTIAYLIAFVLLLISTISTPIVKAIPLATYQDFKFGVFGYCGPTGCSKFSVTYDTDPTSDGSTPTWSLAPNTRQSLSSILIVHPIAALFALICTIMAFACHFHSPAHSSNYLLWVLILSFPTLLITLLAFLVDILLFVPYLSWGGWIVLAATIIITACSVLTCAMRRTMVSRKARKKRIEENSEMNGENLMYANHSQPAIANEPQKPRESAYIRAESPPPLDGKPADKLPQFATFDYERSRPSTDDRSPLNPARDPSIRTTSTTAGRSQRSGERTRPNGAVPGRGYGDDRDRSPVSPIEYDGSAGPESRQNQRYYGGPNGPPRGRGGPPFYGRGGRGGYPPRGGYMGRGGYPPRGGPAPRGGYPPRGAYRGAPNGMRGPPPPDWNGDGGMGPMAAGAGAGMAAGGMMAGNHRGPPDYANEYSNGNPAQDPYTQTPQQYGYDDYATTGPYGDPRQGQGVSQPGYTQDEQPYGAQPVLPGPYQGTPPPQTQTSGYSSPPGEPVRDPATFGFSGPRPSVARGPSSPRNPASPNPPMPPMANDQLPIGQAIEMDATSGSPARSPMVEQGLDGSLSHIAGGPTVPIGSAVTSGDQISGHAATSHQYNNEPIEMGDTSRGNGHDQYDGATTELPGTTTSHNAQASRQRSHSDAYYEDVDPRFAQDEPLPSQQAGTSTAPMPSALMPGFLHPGQGSNSNIARERSGSSFYSTNDPSSEHPSRTRSPAASDNSNFTSISQRGVNPEWAAAQRGPPNQMGAPRSPPAGYSSGVPYNGSYRPGPRPPRVEDQVLSSNPDFAIPGRGHSRGTSGTHRYPDPV